MDVSVGLREGGGSWEKAKSAGIDVMTVSDASAAADIMMMLAPDTSQKGIYDSSIKDNLQAGNYIGFSHGVNIHYKRIVPPENIDVFMVAPKAPGHTVRNE